MFGVCAIEFQLGLQGHAVAQTSVQTFLNRITRRIDKVVDELKHEIVSCVGYWKYLLEYFEQPFVTPVLSSRVELEEVLERLQLHLQKIGVVQMNLRSCE